jgi:hypothetical protein
MNLFSCFCTGLGSQDEVRLVKHLFEEKGYNPLIRPVKNLTDKVNVKFGLAMIQLINVVRIDQSIGQHPSPSQYNMSPFIIVTREVGMVQ